MLPWAFRGCPTSASDRQLNLLNSLLEVDVNDIQDIRLNCQPIQMYRMIQELVEDLKPPLVKNRATLANQVFPDLPLVTAVVTADSLQLRRVFESLLTNALNHT